MQSTAPLCTSSTRDVLQLVSAYAVVMGEPLHGVLRTRVDAWKVAVNLAYTCGLTIMSVSAVCCSAASQWLSDTLGY